MKNELQVMQALCTKVEQFEFINRWRNTDLDISSNITRLKLKHEIALLRGMLDIDSGDDKNFQELFIKMEHDLILKSDLLELIKILFLDIPNDN